MGFHHLIFTLVSSKLFPSKTKQLVTNQKVSDRTKKITYEEIQFINSFMGNLNGLDELESVWVDTQSQIRFRI